MAGGIGLSVAPGPDAASLPGGGPLYSRVESDGSDPGPGDGPVELLTYLDLSDVSDASGWADVFEDWALEGTNDQDLGIRGPMIMATWWDVAPGGLEEFNAWYEQEHIPMLFSVPGWLRIRRFERVSGEGPQFFAIHDLASKEVFGHPIQRAAGSTPWRAEVVHLRTLFDRRIYRLDQHAR